MCIRDRSGAGDWFVRRTNLSFLLGDLPTVGAADGLAQALAQEGIPAYVLEVAYSDGPSRFRVYAGGYASDAESAALAELIRSTGRTPELTERVVILPGG